jgi:hypothetical protein
MTQARWRDAEHIDELIDLSRPVLTLPAETPPAGRKPRKASARKKAKTRKRASAR